MTGPLMIDVDDPRRPDVGRLLDTHLAFARHVTPICQVHALDPAEREGAELTFFTARQDGAVLAVAALLHLDEGSAEIKSMHTAEAARRRGVGRLLLDRLIDEARERGYRRVSLETGRMDGFAAARRLYASAGFEPCEPYGGYGPESFCMTLDLAGRRRTPGPDSS